MKRLNFELYEDRQKFYHTKEWLNLRDYILSTEPLCIKCLDSSIVKPATEIDHIIPLRKSPQDCLNTLNLQPLCKEHHSEKTYLETISKTNKLKIAKPLWKTS